MENEHHSHCKTGKHQRMGTFGAGFLQRRDLSVPVPEEWMSADLLLTAFEGSTAKDRGSAQQQEEVLRCSRDTISENDFGTHVRDHYNWGIGNENEG